MRARAGRATERLVGLVVGSAMFGGALPAAVVAQDPVPRAVEHGSPSAQEAQIVEGVDYRIYDRWGNPTSLPAIVAWAVQGDVLLVGEEHGDMVGHALEVVMLEAVAGEIEASARDDRTVVLSLEMFERDVQYVLDEYLAGLISEAHFLRSSRPWDEYEARYRSLVESARDQGMPVVAANAPRRYVSRVTSAGPESLADLSELGRSYLPPLPYPGPSDRYREQWDALMAAAAASAAQEGREYAANPDAIWSQALWDASMGHAIAEALVRHLGGFVVHFAGSFHVERGTGIPERIADYRPGTKVTTVVMTKVDDVRVWSDEDHGDLGDYVVLTLKPAVTTPEGERPGSE